MRATHATGGLRRAPPTVAAMGSDFVSALAAALIAACGCSTSAPVQTASASGEVASAIADCAQGPPARCPLNVSKYDRFEFDGVVGTIYLETEEPVYVSIREIDRFNPTFEFCRIGWE